MARPPFVVAVPVQSLITRRGAGVGLGLRPWIPRGDPKECRGGGGGGGRGV